MQEAGSATIRFITVGNALTVSRLILLPVIIVGIGVHVGYLVVAAMAAVVITDLLDGRISRRLGQASEFGRNLDSTIDFVLIYSLFIAFFAAGRLAIYQFAIIYLAMVMNLLLQLGTMGSDQSQGVLRTRSGKLTGALEYGYILFLVVREVLPRTDTVATINLVFFIVLAAAIAINTGGCVIRMRRLV
jgi:phosphatidylglycerophosphate synthase